MLLALACLCCTLCLSQAAAVSSPATAVLPLQEVDSPVEFAHFFTAHAVPGVSALLRGMDKVDRFDMHTHLDDGAADAALQLAALEEATAEARREADEARAAAGDDADGDETAAAAAAALAKAETAESAARTAVQRRRTMASSEHTKDTLQSALSACYDEGTSGAIQDKCPSIASRLVISRCVLTIAGAQLLNAMLSHAFCSVPGQSQC